MYVAPFAPYGYRKDPKDVNHLIIDETAAEVVRRIFAKKNRRTQRQCHCRGTDKGRNSDTAGLQAQLRREFPRQTKVGQQSPWRTSQIIRILQNEMYVGNMVQGRTGSGQLQGKKGDPQAA